MTGSVNSAISLENVVSTYDFPSTSNAGHAANSSAQQAVQNLTAELDRTVRASWGSFPERLDSVTIQQAVWDSTGNEAEGSRFCGYQPVQVPALAEVFQKTEGCLLRSNAAVQNKSTKGEAWWFLNELRSVCSERGDINQKPTAQAVVRRLAKDLYEPSVQNWAVQEQQPILFRLLALRFVLAGLNAKTGQFTTPTVLDEIRDPNCLKNGWFFKNTRIENRKIMLADAQVFLRSATAWTYGFRTLSTDSQPAVSPVRERLQQLIETRLKAQHGSVQSQVRPSMLPRLNASQNYAQELQSPDMARLEVEFAELQKLAVMIAGATPVDLLRSQTLSDARKKLLNAVNVDLNLFTNQLWPVNLKPVNDVGPQLLKKAEGLLEAYDQFDQALHPTNQQAAA